MTQPVPHPNPHPRCLCSDCKFTAKSARNCRHTLSIYEHTPAHPPEAQQRIDAAIVELQEAIETPYFYENEQHIKKAIALLQAGDHHE